MSREKSLVEKKKIKKAWKNEEFYKAEETPKKANIVKTLLFQSKESSAF